MSSDSLQQKAYRYMLYSRPDCIWAFTCRERGFGGILGQGYRHQPHASPRGDPPTQNRGAGQAGSALWNRVHNLQIVCEANACHKEIFAAIEKSDGEAARLAMARHISDSLQISLEDYDRMRMNEAGQQTVNLDLPDDVIQSLQFMEEEFATDIKARLEGLKYLSAKDTPLPGNE